MIAPSSRRPSLFRRLRASAFVSVVCGGAALLACSSAEDDSDSSGAAQSEATQCRGTDWNQLRECREKEIETYTKSREQAANFSWFKDSPLGFGGMPYVLFRVLQQTYPDVWPEDNLGFAPHPDDYENGELKPAPKRRHILPYGMVYQDPNLVATRRDAPELQNVFFSCGGCHTGRVIVDGKVKHMFGAPNTEVDPAMFTELTMKYAAKLHNLEADPTKVDLDFSFSNGLQFFWGGVDVLAAKGLEWRLKEMRDCIATRLQPGARDQGCRLTGATNLSSIDEFWGAKTDDPALNEDRLRQAYEQLRLITQDGEANAPDPAVNFKKTVANLVGTGIKAKLIYQTLPGMAGSYGKNDGRTGGNFGPRPGRMDAYGIASGLTVLHSLRKDASGKYDFREKLQQRGIQVPSGDDKAAVIGWWAQRLPKEPAGVDIKSLFWAEDRHHAGWDGNQGNDARVIASGTSAVGDPMKVNRDIHRGMNPFINELPPTPYPFRVDMDLAEKGSTVFRQECASCHKPKNERIYKLDTLGVDVNRATTVGNEARVGLIELMREACVGPDGNERSASWCTPKGDSREEQDNEYYREIRSRENAGYKADVLHGVWASAPYLHNGSVPTLWHMLNPDQRPAKFVRGNINYDQRKVGFVYDEAPAPGSYDNVRAVEYDTNLRGNGNRGHEFGKDLSNDDKSALLEYLKTL